MTVLGPGSLFAGQYRIGRRIGAGGMGAVYEAEQCSTRKRRALKVLTNRFGTDEKAQARFVREATVGADIDSAHVVDVIGAGIDEETGLPWLAMELLDGIDLKQVVDIQGRLSPAPMLAVFEQLGHGLAAAHVAGVVHRDLKPENIFVARSRRAGGSFTVKILDFGIAKITREAVVSTDTATIGSPMWMAPEQINAEPLSVRTDIWALGLLAFWALTGRVYWKAAYGERVTVQALFAEQLFSELPSASERAAAYGVGERIPPEFDAWFAGCVARSVDERFEDARAAMVALKSVLEPVAEIDPRRGEALLPEAGAPDAQTRLNSGPVLGPGAAQAHAEMAGTTADVLSLQGAVPTISGTSPSELGIGVESTSAQGGAADGSTRDPVSESAPPGVASRGRSAGKIVAAVATPAALAGALIAGFVLWDRDDEAEPPPITLHHEVGDETSSEVEPPPVFEPPPPHGPSRSGHVNLSTLPSPSTVRFLGWTADGEHLVVRVGYGSKTHGATANSLELVHVIGGATGRVETSYAVEREAGASIASDDPLTTAAHNARSAEQWLQRRTELLLRQPDARRVPSRRSGEVTLQIDDAPIGSKVQVLPKRAGFDVSWWGFEGVSDEGTPPTVRVAWAEGSARTELVAAELKQDITSLRALASRTKGTAVCSGHIRVYWSPNEEQCLVVLDMQAGADEDGLIDRRWFLASLPFATSGRESAGRDRIRR